MMKALIRTVRAWALINLFKDTASEVLFPVTSLYLRQIGFSVILDRVPQGVAEATAGLGKGYFGNMKHSLMWGTYPRMRPHSCFTSPTSSASRTV